MVAGYKAFSLYSFNSLSKELDSKNQELFTGFKKEIETSNKMGLKLVKSVDFGPNFSKETNTKYINQLESDYDASLKEYKGSIEELESGSSEVTKVSKMPLWLGSDQKKFVSDIASAVDKYAKARKDDYEFGVKSKPVMSNMFLVLEDTIALYNYYLKIASAQQAPITDISSLEKYSKPNFKFDEEDSLSSEFPGSYKAFSAFKDTFGQTYLIFEALSQGDLSQATKLAQVQSQLGASLTTIDTPLDEMAEKQKPYTEKIKDAYVEYTKTLEFFSEKELHKNQLSKEKVLVQNNQNKLTVLAYLVDLYYSKNKKYPTDSSFTSLSSTLETAGFMDSEVKVLNFNTSDFTYTSNGSTYFELGSKDEVSGQEEKVLVGLKEEDLSQTLGATTQISSVKVSKAKINFKFLNNLINYLESITP